MALKRHHQIGISIILGITIIGTIGSFFVMALESDNQAQDQQKSQQLVAAYQDAQNKQTAQLSAQYYPEFSKYQSQVGTFDRADITKLVTEDLKIGTGTRISDSTKFAAYYIGWTSDGKVFDGSIDGESLKQPFSIDGLASTGVIDGWKKGLVGMNIGGVRLLSIPAAQAYGDQAQTGIPANSPLKFVVMAVDQPESVPIPPELLQQLGGQ